MKNTTEQRFGICGAPITQSLSPKLFKAAYPHRRYSYELLPTSDPTEAIDLFLKKELSGMNVTAPLKTAILPLVHRQTPECESIGACNMVLKQDNLLVAHNVDCIGVSNSISEAKVPLKHTPCLLLGAGGAAKAAAFALIEAGASLSWANRTPERIPCTFLDGAVAAFSLAEAAPLLQTCIVIINTLPQSTPETERFRFHPWHVILDASYTSRPFARQASMAGATYIGGERWLFHQAIPSFASMTGASPNVQAMEKVLDSQIIFRAPKNFVH